MSILIDTGIFKAFPDKGTPNTTGFNGCSVPAAQKVVMLCSNVDEGYKITPDDETNQLHEWWIDIPAMVYDSSEITPFRFKKWKSGGERMLSLKNAAVSFSSFLKSPLGSSFPRGTGTGAHAGENSGFMCMDLISPAMSGP